MRNVILLRFRYYTFAFYPHMYKLLFVRVELYPKLLCCVSGRAWAVVEWLTEFRNYLPVDIMLLTL